MHRVTENGFNKSLTMNSKKDKDEFKKASEFLSHYVSQQYYDDLYKVISDISKSSDAPYRKIKKLVETSKDYVAESSTVDDINIILRNYGKSNRLAPYFADLLLDIASNNAKKGVNFSMKEWFDIISAETDKMAQINHDLDTMKKEISGLKDQLAKADRLNYVAEEESSISTWRSKYEQLDQEYKKALNQIDVYKEFLNEKSSNKAFTTREIAIIALALFRKADVVPKNKKSIADLFSKLTGSSVNTLSTNLCSHYTDDEIKAITDKIEEKMPDFANYLKENKFGG